MSAQIMLHVAGLLRTRATAAEQVTPPENWWEYEGLLDAFSSMSGLEDAPLPGVVQDAEHFAPWTPFLAKALADWIESHAKDLEHAGGHLPSCDSPGDVEYAQTVAFAYLGQVPQ